MGNTASSCIVFNAALYAIDVEFFKADDATAAAAKQRYTLLPGQSVKMKIKKAAFIRLSGESEVARHSAMDHGWLENLLLRLKESCQQGKMGKPSLTSHCDFSRSITLCRQWQSPKHD